MTEFTTAEAQAQEKQMQKVTPEQVAMSMSTAVILDVIARQQEIQKRNRPGGPLWNNASEVLAPLFGEMARRTSATS